MRNVAELLLLSALWGASFLLLRIASPVFGPILLIEIRVAIALLVLLPFMFLYGKAGDFFSPFRAIAIASTNSDATDGPDYANSIVSIEISSSQRLKGKLTQFNANEEILGVLEPSKNEATKLDIGSIKFLRLNWNFWPLSIVGSH